MTDTGASEERNAEGMMEKEWIQLIRTSVAGRGRVYTDRIAGKGGPWQSTVLELQSSTGDMESPQRQC